MIESPPRQHISKRVLDLCSSHDASSAYRAKRLYVGSSEYEDIRRCCCNLLTVPLLENYEQGTVEFLGKSIFVLRDIDSHLAIA